MNEGRAELDAWLTEAKARRVAELAQLRALEESAYLQVVDAVSGLADVHGGLTALGCLPERVVTIGVKSVGDTLCCEDTSWIERLAASPEWVVSG